MSGEVLFILFLVWLFFDSFCSDCHRFAFIKVGFVGLKGSFCRRCGKKRWMGLVARRIDERRPGRLRRGYAITPPEYRESYRSVAIDVWGVDPAAPPTVGQADSAAAARSPQGASKP